MAHRDRKTKHSVWLSAGMAVCLARNAAAQVGVTVGDPVQVDTGFTTGGVECTVAVDKCHPDSVLAAWIAGMARSEQGGAAGTWQPLDFPPQPYNEDRFDPFVAFHPHGTYAWHSGIRLLLGASDVNIRRIDPSVAPPGGVSPATVLQLLERDRTAMASGPSGTLPGATMVYAASDSSFAGIEGVHVWRSEVVDVWEDTNWLGPVYAAPGLVTSRLSVGRDATVYLVGLLGSGDIRYSVSADDAASWSAVDSIGAANVDRRFDSWVRGEFRVPQVASIDARCTLTGDTALYVAYMALAGSGSNDVDIFVKRGLPNGTGGWSWTEAPILVSDDSYRGCAQVDQFWPYLTVDERGYLHIVYYEACDGDCAPGSVVEIFPVYCFSDDGGVRFTRYELGGNPPVPWTVDCAETFIGDYIGIDSGREQVYPLYTGGNQNGRIFSNQVRAEAFNPADFDADCMVDLNDFSTFANCFGLPLWRGCYLTDLDGDCDVDLGDYATFAVNYGLQCPPGWPDAGERSQSNDSIDLDMNALADWTVQNVPTGQRQEFAQRCVETAEQSDDDVTAARLLDFAEAIVP